MLKGKTIAVVIPSFNVEKLIENVVRTLPDFVDYAVSVNDGSHDGTGAVLERLSKETQWLHRLVVLTHPANRGVGAAIATGYVWCVQHEIDVAAVMAGDGQMDPGELQNVVTPVIDGIVDYCKGNRLFTDEAIKNIPWTRFFGNSVLSLLTKIASGYWHVADSQTGYTAASLEILKTIDLHGIYPRYGMPNDMLVKLNIHDFRVMDMPVRPVYNVGEKSGIKVGKVIFTISWLLVRLFFKRMWVKYVIHDFHPLVLFYGLGLICLPTGLTIGICLYVYSLIVGSHVPVGWIIVALMLVLSGLQQLLFAMWFDMDYNRHLFVFQKRRRGHQDHAVE